MARDDIEWGTDLTPDPETRAYVPCNCGCQDTATPEPTGDTDMAPLMRAYAAALRVREPR